MKNLNYFPFERNRYFYGKLLSVNDFESEQKYLNDKRRIINRFLHGVGVVCGMNPVIVDDKTISIEMGLALDFAGREIVIDTPVVNKLSVLDGFEMDSDEYKGYYYLCIDYDEKEVEEVHNIANSSNSVSGKKEYSKYLENYKLYLTDKEPENENFSYRSHYEKIKTVYWGNGIRIKQLTPKYVKEGERFNLKIIVENMGQQMPISFNYKLELDRIEFEGKNIINISFDEKKLEKKTMYELEYSIDSKFSKEVEANIKMINDSFKMKIGKKSVANNVEFEDNIKIIKGNVLEEINKKYFETAMDEITKKTYMQSIYLAKIYVVKAGTSYAIDKMLTMPFDQYIFNNEMLSVLNQMYINKNENNDRKVILNSKNNSKNELLENIKTTSSGTITIDLGIGGSKGQKFFSPPIAHGLGLGNVSVNTGISNNSLKETEIVYGVSNIFAENEDIVKIELATKVDINKGTFIIGVKFLEDTAQRQIKLYWTANMDTTPVLKSKVDTKMYINPDMVTLTTRQTKYFEAVIDGNVISRVNWSASSGGTIDANGLYTAPNQEGVYEITAVSVDDPNIFAKTFIVVK